MKPFKKLFDAFRGAGEAAVTIPSMDGSLRPNSLLDRASVVFGGEGDVVSCVTNYGEGSIFSHGRILLRLDDKPNARAEKLAEFDERITAAAAHSSGRIALGLSGKGLVIRGVDGTVRTAPGQAVFNCPLGLVFEDENSLIVANGSEQNRPEQWRRDLMEKNRSGSIWRIDLNNGASTCLAKDLAYPSGIAKTGARELVISESWRHRLLLLKPNGGRSTVLDDLPGYPGSIAPSRDGGYWLAVFAPRRQLVEFVLREDGYRRQMMATLDERHWVAPSLKTGIDYFEPVQSGGVRRLGILKPWAPTRSYGLIVRLDDTFNPQSSYHGRAGSCRHGITSVAEHSECLLAVCAASNQLLALDPNLTED